ncbi:acyl-CoA synthetase / AMP-(fatty) acid ligase [Campylobacter iguaniorum]|uniref:Acyl-CoA synthetase / AMP-(Fatty) acid ligase n=1 Tax=Campylobacter iguaniorum TaxID=1244531 RepID=A0A076FC17_9BACT|nr:AMP-binding protein [Campylobacter iguaniorum]AII15491.1 acyl-CoA synthetase / AMP-(fatty) acid ligase [Campylobacter iguaniorum]
MINENVYFLEEKSGFSELADQSLKFGSYLRSKNIKEIKIYLSSTFDFCVALFGAMSANALAHVVSDAKFADINDDNFAHFSGDLDSEFELNLDYEFFLYTSGSSGSSKAIKKSLKDMFEEAIFLRDFLSLNAQNLYTSVTHQHMFGLTFKVFLPLIAGLKVLSKKLDYPEIVLSYDFTNTIFISSPVVLSAISKYGGTNINKADLIVTAGSKLENELRNKFDAKIMEIYGSTETGIVAANFGSGFEILGGVNLSLNDQERLIINSKWCKEYLSSDMAEISGKSLKLLGRFDRIIKLNEFRFSLDEAECELKNHKFISDSKCALLAGDTRIKALICLSKEGKDEFRNSGKNGIIKALKGHLFDKFKTNIRHFKIVEKIEKNSYGKFSVDDFKRVWQRKLTPKFELINPLEMQANISEECFFFEGHFRDFPLVPGFMQVGFVMDALSELGTVIDKPYNVENLKFTAFLRPFDICKITISKEANLINFKVYANEKISASGRIRIV